MLSRFFILSLLVLTLLAPSGHQAFADPSEQKITKDQNTPCPKHVSGHTIAYAMMALVATDNCKDFPHTKREVKAYIESLKCNAKAKTAIENLGPKYMERFDYLFYGSRLYKSCQEAINFKPTITTY